MNPIRKIYKGVEVESSSPTVQDIQYVSKIYRRLEGDSEAETITNLLEWQEQNIHYWKERYWVANGEKLFLISLIIILLLVCVTLFFNMINIPDIALISTKALLVSLWFTCTIFIFLAVFVCIILPYNYYSHVAREQQITHREKFRRLFRLVWHTIKPSIPLDRVLEYRLAVCRDYAKLTAALLLNKYSCSDVYFLTLPNHIAAAVKINGRYYVLDQRLPIMSLDSWLQTWEWLLWWERIKSKILHKKYAPKCEIHFLQTEKDKNGTIRISFLDSESYKLKHEMNKNLEICIKRLEEVLTSELNLNYSNSNHGEPNLRIPLKNYAIYCEDDEIILYSIARSIKNRIEAELCGNIKKLSWVRIAKKDDRDLVVEIYLD